MKILKYKKYFLGTSLFLVLLSWFSILYFGFNLGIDFKGGTLYEIKYSKEVPELQKIKEEIIKSGYQNFGIQKLGQDSYVIKLPELNTQKKEVLDKNLKELGNFQEVQVRTISSSISKEFVNKSLWAIVLVVLAIIIFITYVFSGVSYPVSSFKYGLIAIITLLHDISIPAGFFAFMGSFDIKFEIDVLFVTALLAILGYSVNDTIVVFDRIRENLKKVKDIKKIKEKEFEEIVEKSLHQTFRRSLFTSLTTLIVLIALYLFGGENTKEFALVLIIGITAGTYSSIFVASPLLVLVNKYWKSEYKEKKKIDEMTPEERLKELVDID